MDYTSKYESKIMLSKPSKITDSKSPTRDPSFLLLIKFHILKYGTLEQKHFLFCFFLD